MLNERVRTEKIANSDQHSSLHISRLVTWLSPQLKTASQLKGAWQYEGIILFMSQILVTFRISSYISSTKENCTLAFMPFSDRKKLYIFDRYDS